MAYNITDENLLSLSLALADEDEYKDDEIQRRHITIIGTLIFVGAEQLHYERSECRQARRIYLVRNDLLPNPRLSTPWQALYSGQNNRAFITTMGLDVPTFHHILSHGFATLWNTTPSSVHRMDHQHPEISTSYMSREHAWCMKHALVDFEQVSISESKFRVAHVP